MKTILSYFLLLVLAVSCQMKPNQTTDNQTKEDTSITDGVEFYQMKFPDSSDVEESYIADTVKATAVFWIDKSDYDKSKKQGLRTVKAKVQIYENGKVELLSFVKKQSLDAEKYIRRHLAKFKVSERMLESGYVESGEQFVQLRCLRDKLEGK